jgi:hypothetical protein
MGFVKVNVPLKTSHGFVDQETNSECAWKRFTHRPSGRAISIPDFHGVDSSPEVERHFDGDSQQESVECSFGFS